MSRPKSYRDRELFPSWKNFDPVAFLESAMPIEEFCGLNSREMYHLFRGPLGEGSPLRIRDAVPDEALDQVPFLRVTEEFLEVVSRDGPIRLTPLGALPRKILRELYDLGYIKEEFIESGVTKLLREIDSVSLTTLHATTKLAGLIREHDGRLTLTPTGKRLLHPDNRNELFRLILETFTEKFDWSSNDGYQGAPIGQLGWGFTVYLLLKFGETEQTVQLYADRYLKAFPALIIYYPEEHFASPQERFVSCYALRSFDRFLDWFGCVEIEREDPLDERGKSQVRRTDVMARIFTVD